MIPHILTNDNLVLRINGENKTVDRSHPQFEWIVAAVRAGADPQSVLDRLDIRQVLIRVGNIVIDGERVTYKGANIGGYFVTKIVEFAAAGRDVTRLLKGLDRLQENPSYRIREQLYRFLERGNIAWDDDGRFLAYKKIRSDYTDVHTGTIDNSVGNVVEMDRRNVDDDPEQTCSRGLHVCSQEYLHNFSGARVVVVAVDPADVVAIPIDYNHTKMRVCRYEVREEVALDRVSSYERDYYNEPDEYEDDYSYGDYDDYE